MNESALLDCQREERLRVEQIEKEPCSDRMVNRLVERYGFLSLMAIHTGDATQGHSVCDQSNLVREHVGQSVAHAPPSGG
jgi:hypothetical protein